MDISTMKSFYQKVELTETKNSLKFSVDFEPKIVMFMYDSPWGRLNKEITTTTVTSYPSAVLHSALFVKSGFITGLNKDVHQTSTISVTNNGGTLSKVMSVSSGDGCIQSVAIDESAEPSKWDINIVFYSSSATSIILGNPTDTTYTTYNLIVIG